MPILTTTSPKVLSIPKVLWIAEQAADIVDHSRLSLTVVHSALDGLRAVRDEDFDVVMASFPGDDWDSATTLLEGIQQAQPGTPVVIHAPEAGATDVVRLMQSGAFHVLQYGDATSLLCMAANSKWSETADTAEEAEPPEHWQRFLIGESRPMRRIIDTIRLVAQRRCTVLITG